MVALSRNYRKVHFMNETKLNWSDLSLFLAVARGGGLAAGARISGLSPPSLGRHMVNLEQVTGDVLFSRRARGYELTQAGEVLLEDAERVEEQILNIERRRDNRVAHRPIQISAGSWMSYFLAQHIHQISTADTRLIFFTHEERHNISRREATIGIRNARPDENALVTRKTTRVSFAPYASTSQSTTHDWIAATGQTPSANWVRANRRDQIWFEASSPRSILDLAFHGAGTVVLPCFVGDSESGLSRTGPIIPELCHDQWLVVHGEDRNKPEVRRTVDLITKLLVSKRKDFAGIA